MKTSKTIAKLFANMVSAFLLTLILTSLFSEQLSISNPLAVASCVTAISVLVQFLFIVLGYKSNAPKVAYMALLQEVWSAQIQENLYMGNEFMKKATDHSMWVKYKTVHVPQAGSTSTVEQNRTVFPATIGSRTDSELTYSLNQYTADPILIQNIEELQISYNKRASILFNMMSQLQFVVSTQTLYAWAPSGASRIVQTTGSTSANNLPHSTATGTRKMTTIQDITRLKAILDADNIPQAGRILLVPQYMYNTDLLNIAGIVQAYQFGTAIAPEGVVARLMGFDIMIRSEVLVYDNTGTPVLKAINGDGSLTSAAATDQGAGIAFHPSYVCHALGSITPYYNAGSNGNGLPEYYGSIFSAEVMHGASKLRTDQKGIVALVQGT
jgi:hypothetical protein